MPSSRRSGLASLNTSIKLFRKSAALNSSRRILQKSINRSIISAASLKSNNASLAKRLGELQIELQSQRTAAYKANLEANQLRLQLAQFHACMESRIRLKEQLVLLREQVTAIFETGVNVTRCVDAVSKFLDISTDCDQSILQSETTSKLFSSDQPKERSNVALPSVIIPASPSPSPAPTTLEARLRNVVLRRPAVPDVSIDQPSVVAPEAGPFIPVVTNDARIPGCSIFNPESPVPLIQPTPVTVCFGSPLPSGPQILDPPVALDHNSPSPAVSERRPSVSSPSIAAPSLHASPPQPTPSSPEEPLSSDIPSPIVFLENHIPNDQLPSPIAPRAHLMREVRCRTVPIIDDSSTVLPSPDSKPPTRSKRRRIVREQDSDEELVDDRKSKRSFTRKSSRSSPNPPGPRVVEVHINRPGHVAFRADLKHSVGRVEAGGVKSQKPISNINVTKSHSQNPSYSNTDTGKLQAKSVFDLSANQTANLSALPSTLDELRQKGLENKQLPLQEYPQNRPGSHLLPRLHPTPCTTEPNLRHPNAFGTENVAPVQHSSTVSSITVHSKTTAIPTESKSGRSTPTRSPLQSTKKPAQRYRRLCLHDDDEDVEPIVKRRSSTRIPSPDANLRRTRSKSSRQN